LTHKARRPNSRSHEDATLESLHRDPLFAAEYLNGVLADGNKQELMVALRRVAAAFGGISKLAGNAKLNATTLYRTLSPKGNPELKSMNSILTAMGLRLAVEPIAKVTPKARRLRKTQDFLTGRSGAAKPKDLIKYLRRAPVYAPLKGDEGQ
jgi:probable addiction module antidote protein